MQAAKDKYSNEYDHLSRAIGQKARELFISGQYMCTPAVLLALNRGLNAGLDEELLLKVSAGMPEGMGGAGCLCGAVSGAGMALGLFLAHGKATGRGNRKVAGLSHGLHDEFKRQCGSTCCRVLTKKVKHDTQAHMEQCARFSALAAELACRMILAERPELASGADLQYLSAAEKKKSGLKKILGALGK